jgi:hypothetical protein
MHLNIALPCRIWACNEWGKTSIGMIQPVPMLAALSEDDRSPRIAQDVFGKTRQVIVEAG